MVVLDENLIAVGIRSLVLWKIVMRKWFMLLAADRVATKLRS